MSESNTIEALVDRQFGSRAEAYLKSQVHAQGRDLEDMVAFVSGRSDARVLDMGCGGGHVTFAVALHAREVVAYDLSGEMLGVVAKAAADRGLVNVATKQGMAERLPFEDGQFDVVLSRYSTHHWRDLDAGLREAARVLRPGGIAAFIDTVSLGTPLLDTWFQALELLRDCSHVRNYSRAEWQAKLAHAGFVPGASRQYRVHLNFDSWVERMATPDVFVAAIRALHGVMPGDVQRHYAVEDHGSFSIDTVMFEAAKPAA